MSTWQERLKALLGPRGYDVCMRRSLQTVVLYEAKRAIEPRLQSLKPYQRKAAFLEQCYFLLESLDLLYPNQKDEVMWRTMSSRVPLDGPVAWSRLKGINKELESLSEQIKPFLAPDRSHTESVDMLVQSLFEGKDESNKGKNFSWTWEHAHNHVVMAYRLYYDGDKLDATFPAANICPDMHVPQEPPKKAPARVLPTAAGQKAGASTVAAVPSAAKVAGTLQGETEDLDVAAILGETKPAEERQRLLQEVRQHLDILKEFEGVISEEEIAKRKRELFAALPSAPAPAAPSSSPGPSSKKHKTETIMESVGV